MPPKTLNQACQEIGIQREVFLEFVSHEWIHPSPEEAWEDEDILRARLILELQRDFGVNDEAVPIILHLLDQLYSLQAAMSERFKENKAA